MFKKFFGNIKNKSKRKTIFKFHEHSKKVRKKKQNKDWTQKRFYCKKPTNKVKNKNKSIKKELK